MSRRGCGLGFVERQRHSLLIAFAAGEREGFWAAVSDGDGARSDGRAPRQRLMLDGDTHSSGLAIPAGILRCRSPFQKFLRRTLQGVDHFGAHPAIWIGTGEVKSECTLLTRLGLRLC